MLRLIVELVVKEEDGHSNSSYMHIFVIIIE